MSFSPIIVHNVLPHLLLLLLLLLTSSQPSSVLQCQTCFVCSLNLSFHPSFPRVLCFTFSSPPPHLSYFPHLTSHLFLTTISPHSISPLTFSSPHFTSLHLTSHFFLTTNPPYLSPFPHHQPTSLHLTSHLFLTTNPPHSTSPLTFSSPPPHLSPLTFHLFFTSPHLTSHLF